MTQLQAIKAMRKRYPDYSVSVEVTMWDFGGRQDTTYKVYAGGTERAHANGESHTSFQEAFDNCKEF